MRSEELTALAAPPRHWNREYSSSDGENITGSGSDICNDDEMAEEQNSTTKPLRCAQCGNIPQLGRPCLLTGCHNMPEDESTLSTRRVNIRLPDFGTWSLYHHLDFPAACGRPLRDCNASNLALRSHRSAKSVLAVVAAKSCTFSRSALAALAADTENFSRGLAEGF